MKLKKRLIATSLADALSLGATSAQAFWWPGDWFDGPGWGGYPYHGYGYPYHGYGYPYGGYGYPYGGYGYPYGGYPYYGGWW